MVAIDRPHGLAESGYEATNRGLALLRQGACAAAIEAFTRAKNIAPDDPHIDYYLGETYRLCGEHARALDYFRLAQNRGVNTPELLLRRGLAHSALGDDNGAERCYRTALLHRPAYVEALANLANVLERRGSRDEAIRTYERALLREPGFLPALRNLGLLYFNAGRWNEAAANLERALQGQGDDSFVAEKLAIALGEAGRVDDAIARYEAILRKDADNVAATLNLGNLLFNVGRPAAALAQFAALADRFPDSAVYELHRGIALYSLLRQADAGRSFRRAHRLAPHCTASRKLGLERVLGRISFYEGVNYLLAGNLAAGWEGYEYRWAAKEPRPPEIEHLQAQLWDGKRDPARRVFVFREQGLGDEIMFASLFDEVIANSGHCVIQCSQRLGRIFARSFPRAEIHPAEETHDEWVRLSRRLNPDDHYVFAGSLPKLLRRSRAAFPRRDAYLRADARGTAIWRERLSALGPGLKVGFSWQGGTLTNGSRYRSLPLDALLPVLGIDGVVPISVQYTDCAAELARFEKTHGITVHHWPAAMNDFDQTIDLLAALDLVISVQTTVVHAAGALGRDTWVLLPRAETSWKWFGHGDECAWYPSVTLLHQAERGDWHDVIARTARKLAARVGAGNTGQ